jgi:hypothetical protein
MNEPLCTKRSDKRPSSLACEFKPFVPFCALRIDDSVGCLKVRIHPDSLVIFVDGKARDLQVRECPSRPGERDPQGIRSPRIRKRRPDEMNYLSISQLECSSYETLLADAP